MLSKDNSESLNPQLYCERRKCCCGFWGAACVARCVHCVLWEGRSCRPGPSSCCPVGACCLFLLLRLRAWGTSRAAISLFRGWNLLFSFKPRRSMCLSSPSQGLPSYWKISLVLAKIKVKHCNYHQNNYWKFFKKKKKFATFAWTWAFPGPVSHLSLVLDKIKCSEVFLGTPERLSGFLW